MLDEYLGDLALFEKPAMGQAARSTYPDNQFYGNLLEA